MGLILEAMYDYIKRFSPYIVGGVVGAVIHRIRTQMTIIQFFGSVLVSVFVALSVGLLCKDYFEIQEDTVIFVLCGISGTFSKVILDEIEEIIKYTSVIVKNKFGGKDE